jgi:signal transduction histidine kinase
VSPHRAALASSAPASTDAAEAAILLVDDQDMNLRLLEAILKGRDETLVKARSGPEALKALLERDFAVVLLDVQMPGMDGFETAQLVRERERSRHTPILFVTAIDRDAEHVRRGYLLGAVDYLFKPLDPDVLRAKVSAFVDLWRMRQAERRAKEALAERTRELERSNADLAQFGQIVAHDLQAPLRTVGGYLDLLARRAGDALDDKARQWIGRAKDDLERMHALIRDLLSYARVRTERPALEATDSDAVARQAIEGLRGPIQDAGAEVTVDGLPRVLADPTQLAQVFQNLVDNAVKFRSGPGPKVRLTAERRADEWLFRVADDGIGIDAKDHARVFEPCIRLHARDDYAGTGLGLAICRKAVEAHGGRIGVESQKGKGSTFWFTLPCKATADTPR